VLKLRSEVSRRFGKRAQIEQMPNDSQRRFVAGLRAYQELAEFIIIFWKGISCLRNYQSKVALALVREILAAP
jgi:hypothetical protein